MQKALPIASKGDLYEPHNNERSCQTALQSDTLEQPIGDAQLLGSDLAWNNLCMQTMMLRQQSPELTKSPDTSTT